MARRIAAAARYKVDIEDVQEVTQTNRGPFGLLEAENILKGLVWSILDHLEADNIWRTG